MPSRSLRAASARAAMALVVSSVVLGVAGCPDPEQTFDDFGERYEALDPQQASSTSTGPVEGCQVPEVGGEVDGTYLFVLSPGQLGAAVAAKPLLFTGQVTIVEGGAGPEMNLVLTGLGTPYRDDDSIDPLQPVGGALDLGSHPIAADGTFVAELPEISVAGQANPVSPGTLTATVTLRGQVCANAEGDEGDVVLGFFCGSVEGVVTEPTDITLDAAKNTFTFTKYEGALPTEAAYNCAGDLANPFSG